MAGLQAERQENSFIDIINSAVTKNGGPVTLVAGQIRLTNIVKAEKFSGRQTSGSEPYTDVQLFVLNKVKPINISMKGPTAPSLAGGGLKGIETIIPGLAKKFMKLVLIHLKKKIKDGDKVPDVYSKISDTDKVKIVVGNEAIGGPIHYMYIGHMDVTSTIQNKKPNIVVIVNGVMKEAKLYAKTHELYFRLRARREDQRFDSKALDKLGIPKIYGKSPSKGDSAGRIVVTDKIPNNAEKVTII